MENNIYFAPSEDTIKTRCRIVPSVVQAVSTDTTKLI